MSFSAWRCWIGESMTMSAVRGEQHTEEVKPYLIFWHQKISVASFWKPYSELDSSISSTLSPKVEVRQTVTFIVQQCCKVQCLLWQFCHTHASSSSMTCLWGSCFHSDHTALMVCVEMTVTYYQTFASHSPGVIPGSGRGTASKCWLGSRFLRLILILYCYVV